MPIINFIWNTTAHPGVQSGKKQQKRKGKNAYF
jgi:hypothetical protein